MSQELKKRILSSIFLIPAIFLIIISGSIIFNLFLLICFIIILYEWHMMRKENKYYYIGIIFLIFSFYTIHKIYDYNNNFNFIFILLVCISTDIGGYVFGKFFKGPKLISISPNKTYSGVIGGYLFSILSIIILFKFSFFFPSKINLLSNTYILVILISTISQLGDILVSYFKRLSNVKDTGNLIPGHGGLLDRADGIIFAFPFAYIILSIDLKLY